MKHKRPPFPSAALAAALLFAAPLPASADTFQSGAWTCGYALPSCATYSLSLQSVEVSHDCGYPIAVKVTVENGRGALVKFREAEGNITIGPPRSDEEEGETAYYSGISCCENPYDDFNYTCDET